MHGRVVLLPRLPNVARPRLDAATVPVGALRDELFAGGPDERFRLGLDVIVRGLATYIQD